MTSPNASATAGRAHEGTVFDIGYRSYTGTREGRGRSRSAMFKDGVRISLGFGRGVRAKILPWIFIAVLSGVGLIMAMIVGAAERLAGEGAAARLNLPSHDDYYSIVASIVFVFAALVAPELLCRDRREGTINLYLVRPLTGTDYVSARWASFMVIMLLTLWMPQVILFLGLAAGDPVPLEYIQAQWLDIPKFLLAGLVMAAFATSIAMMTASFTTRRAYASVFLVGLFLISTPFTVGLAQELDGTAGQWLSMFSLLLIPLHVNDRIFGSVSEVTEDAPARALGFTVLLLWYFLWTFGPMAILWWRYRKLAP